jgi:hypothetical protein
MLETVETTKINHSHISVFVEGAWFCLTCTKEIAITKVGS